MSHTLLIFGSFSEFLIKFIIDINSTRRVTCLGWLLNTGLCLPRQAAQSISRMVLAQSSLALQRWAVPCHVHSRAWSYTRVVWEKHREGPPVCCMEHGAANPISTSYPQRFAKGSVSVPSKLIEFQSHEDFRPSVKYLLISCQM